MQRKLQKRKNSVRHRCYPSAAGFLSPRSRFRVVHRLRRADFDKGHNGTETATHSPHIRSNLLDSIPRTEGCAARRIGSSFDNVRARLYYAHVGFRLR